MISTFLNSSWVMCEKLFTFLCSIFFFLNYSISYRKMNFNHQRYFVKNNFFFFSQTLIDKTRVSRFTATRYETFFYDNYNVSILQVNIYIVCAIKMNLIKKNFRFIYWFSFSFLWKNKKKSFTEKPLYHGKEFLYPVLHKRVNTSCNALSITVNYTINSGNFLLRLISPIGEFETTEKVSVCAKVCWRKFLSIEFSFKKIRANLM